MGAGASVVRTSIHKSEGADTSTPIHFSQGGTYYKEDFGKEEEDSQEREELGMSQLGGAPLATQPDEQVLYSCSTVFSKKLMKSKIRLRSIKKTTNDCFVL